MKLMQPQVKGKASFISISGCYWILSPAKLLLWYFPLVTNGFNLLGISRGHSLECYDLHLSITKYQYLNSEILKIRTWLKVCVLCQQHEVASLSPERQMHNLPP